MISLKHLCFSPSTEDKFHITLRTPPPSSNNPNHNHFKLQFNVQQIYNVMVYYKTFEISSIIILKLIHSYLFSN